MISKTHLEIIQNSLDKYHTKMFIFQGYKRFNFIPAGSVLVSKTYSQHYESFEVKKKNNCPNS